MSSCSISKFFPPAKRVKSAEEETVNAVADDGSSYFSRILEPDELPPNHHTEKALVYNDSSTYTVVSSSAKEDSSELSNEQKLRMELNRTIASSKKNIRMCEEAVRAINEFPDFKDILVETTWLEVLKEEFNKPYMGKLSSFVKQEASGNIPIYPPPAKVFNAFNSCPFERVKVVLLGQDPYHGPGQAMGLSFSVPQGIPIPSSLMNMYKELHSDVGCTIPSHGNLEKWAYQGVLLLNAVLTVREHQANSHAKKGWEDFTDAAIRAISQRKKGVVFLLWGKSAKEKTRLIDCNAHHVLKAAHPSGLSAHRGFFKCSHFSETNKILQNNGHLPINWQL